MSKVIDFSKEKEKRIKKRAENEIKDFLSDQGVHLETINFEENKGEGIVDIEFTLDFEVDE
tara:strand:+ start:962 stop:1144 length:183 start_codon:yes stop_codon:yes gene_type:complete